jgi:hypothetical protein
MARLASIDLFALALLDGTGFPAQRVPGAMLIVPADALALHPVEVDAEKRAEGLIRQL